MTTWHGVFFPLPACSEGLDFWWNAAENRLNFVVLCPWAFHANMFRSLWLFKIIPFQAHCCQCPFNGPLCCPYVVQQQVILHTGCWPRRLICGKCCFSTGFVENLATGIWFATVHTILLCCLRAHSYDLMQFILKMQLEGPSMIPHKMMVCVFSSDNIQPVFERATLWELWDTTIL